MYFIRKSIANRTWAQLVTSFSQGRAVRRGEDSKLEAGHYLHISQNKHFVAPFYYSSYKKYGDNPFRAFFDG